MQNLDDNSCATEQVPESPGGCWIGVFVVICAPFWLVGAQMFCQPAEAPKGNRTQLTILLDGVTPWNEWRDAHPNVEISVHGFDIGDIKLPGANLRSASLARCNMNSADLSGSSLVNADASASNLIGANISNVDAQDARFYSSDLSGANLSGSNLTRGGFARAKLVGANLKGADLSGADLMFADLQDMENWHLIKDIRCANIFGAAAPRGFRQWALDRGALQYEREEYKDWLVDRDVCLAD